MFIYIVVKCFNCNQRGHFTKDCKKIICYRCKEAGHIAKDCINTPDAGKLFVFNIYSK